MKVSRQNTNYIWGLSLKESIIAAMFGALIAISKLIIKIPLHIPGHSGLVWMTILTVCCLLLRQGRAGTLAGIVSGVLAVILGLGNEGILIFFKYFVPGLVMDFTFSLLPALMYKWYFVAVVSAFAHWTKLLVNYIAGLILDLPSGFLMLGLKVSTLNHIVFGFIAGIIAYLICSKNLRSGRNIFFTS